MFGGASTVIGCASNRITTACSERDMDKVHFLKCWQRVADAGRYAKAGVPVIWSFLMTVVAALALLAAERVTPQEPPLTALDEFSLDGLDVGTRVMIQSMDIVLQRFGPPERIEFGRANWDVDLEETPAEWIYPGFTVTTLYLRDGLTVAGVDHLVPGSYREGGLVVGIRVFDEGVRIRFGLGVGVDVQEVVDRLGPPPRHKPSNIGLEYRSYSEGERTRTGVQVKFLLDGPGGKVREIIWEREPWH